MIAQNDIGKRQSFKKYLLVSETDKNWGFYLNDLGNTVIGRDSEYPSKGHPGRYMFSWEKGRILDEFHFVLITRGEGIFESQPSGQKKIGPGDGFWLFPGVWHRYRPTKKTGWTEQWVGFSGTLAGEMMKPDFFSPLNPVVPQAAQLKVLALFETLFGLVHDEPFGFQRVASGVCLQLMAELYNIQQGRMDTQNASSMVSRVKSYMYERLNQTVDFKQLAREMGISYSKFRKDFSGQTGISPLQYHLHLKIERAGELLVLTGMTIKEIAWSLGFDSYPYFCRQFSQKTGMSPGEYRKKRMV